MNEHGEPRPSKHVSLQAVQKHIQNGTIVEYGGSEPGFRGGTHGTNFRRRAASPGIHSPPLHFPGTPAYQASIVRGGDQDAGVIDLEDEEGEDIDEEEEEESPALGEQVGLSKFYNGAKRKRTLSVGSAASATAGAAHAILDIEAPGAYNKRGRKPGGQRKEDSRPWTDAECVALLQLYVDNPRSTHKAVAEMHHAKFWANDLHWEGRSFSACQQRMIVLNNKSRDRARLSGSLAQMKSVIEVAEGAGPDHGTRAEEEEARRVVETDWKDSGLGTSKGGGLDVMSADVKRQQRMAMVDFAADVTGNSGVAVFKEPKDDIPHDGSGHIGDAEYEPDASDANAAQLLLSLSGRWAA